MCWFLGLYILRVHDNLTFLWKNHNILWSQWYCDCYSSQMQSCAPALLNCKHYADGMWWHRGYGDPWGGLTLPGRHSPGSYNPQPICLTYVPPLQRALWGIAFTRRLEQTPYLIRAFKFLRCSSFVEIIYLVSLPQKNIVSNFLVDQKLHPIELDS